MSAVITGLISSSIIIGGTVGFYLLRIIKFSLFIYFFLCYTAQFVEDSSPINLVLKK